MQVATLLTVPEDFDFNPQSGKHGDRTHRMELRRASVEYVAPSEYMVGTHERLKQLMFSPQADNLIL